MVAHQCWAGDFRVGEFADAGWNLHNREPTQHGTTETEICMAQQVNVKFVDDLDGSDAQWPCVRAVSRAALQDVFAGRSGARGLNARPLGQMRRARSRSPSTAG